MNNYIVKFMVVFFGIMFITGALTMGMLALINPNDPNSIFTGVGFFLITFLPLLFGGMWYLKRGLTGSSKKEKLLMQTGKQAPATILGVQDTGVTINDIYPMIRLALKVEPSGDSPFEAVIEIMVSRVNFPRVGDVIKVVYDPTNHKNIMAVREESGS